MTNENPKKLYVFQQLVRSTVRFSAAEECVKSLKDAIDDAVYGATEVEQLTAEEFKEYKEIDKLLSKVRTFIEESQSRMDKRKCKAGHELEMILSGAQSKQSTTFKENQGI